MTATTTATERTCKLSRNENGINVLTIKEAKGVRVRRITTDHYYVEYFKPSFGRRAVRLTKVEEYEQELKVYDILLDGNNSTCECLGFLGHGHCRHVEALTALEAAGRLPQICPYCWGTGQSPSSDPMEDVDRCSECDGSGELS